VLLVVADAVEIAAMLQRGAPTDFIPQSERSPRRSRGDSERWPRHQLPLCVIVEAEPDESATPNCSRRIRSRSRAERSSLEARFHAARAFESEVFAVSRAAAAGKQRFLGRSSLHSSQDRRLRARLEFRGLKSPVERSTKASPTGEPLECFAMRQENYFRVRQERATSCRAWGDHPNDFAAHSFLPGPGCSICRKSQF